MAYETKALFIAIAEIMRRCATLEEAYAALANMANAEGVVLKPYKEAKAKDEDNAKVTSK